MEVLTLDRLDALTLAMFAGVDVMHDDLTVRDLVPFVEWNWVQNSVGQARRLLAKGPLLQLQRELRSGNALSTTRWNSALGFVRVRRQQGDTENVGWLGFLKAFERAAQRSALDKTLASQLAGVVKEMEDNVHAHSGRPSSGIVAFVSHETKFEFVVVDRGIGVLESLRQAPEFSNLMDHGTALRLAISSGNSRFGTHTGHGFGFSDLTVGVANSNALVRFHSGDFLLELDGRGRGQISTRCVQRATGRGFLIAVQVGG
jgi:hypothetical protein